MNDTTDINSLSLNYSINETSLLGQNVNVSFTPQSASNGADGIRGIATSLLESLLKETEKKELQDIRFFLIRRLANSLNSEMLIKYNILPDIQSFAYLMDFITQYPKFVFNGAVLSIDIQGRGTLEDLSSLIKFYLHFNKNGTVDYEIVNNKGVNKETTQKSIEDFISEVENGEE